MKPSAILAGVLAAAVSSAAGAALAQSAPSGPPPAWDSLIPCAKKTDPAEGFACYQAALKAAGYAPDVKEVAAEKRRVFGFPRPSLNLLHHPPKDQQAKAEKPPKPQKASAAEAAPAPASAPAPDDEERITVQLAEVALIPPANKLLLVTTDGAVWEQTDSEPVRPFPKAGQTIQIRHTGFGGYFCAFSRVTAVRCIRKH